MSLFFFLLFLDKWSTENMLLLARGNFGEVLTAFESDQLKLIIGNRDVRIFVSKILVSAGM